MRKVSARLSVRPCALSGVACGRGGIFDLERWRDRLDRVRSLAWIAAYRQWIERFARRPPPRGAGIVGALLFLTLALGYGALIGGHVPAIVDWLKDTRDQAANAAGFRIAAVSLTGQ